MTHQKLQQIKQALNAKFFDRTEEIDALLTALLARQHILFIGPAGTGKSALSSMLGEIVEGSRYFQHLLTPFSTPEELFGVLSLKDLEQGVYKRNISGMLPEAHFAFIDEIFKANSAILNSLLTLINERIYYNNGVPIRSPLMTIVGSSNEYIEEGEGLEALFDRFLLRYEVEYIKDTQTFLSMLKQTTSVSVPKLTMDELTFHQEVCGRVEISDSIYETLGKIRQQLMDEGIRPSDRRFKQALPILRAQAYLDGRTEVAKADVAILKHALWEQVEQKDKTAEIVMKIAHDSIESFIERVGPEFEEILLKSQNAMVQKTPDARKELSDLLVQGKTLFLEVQAMTRQQPDRVELRNLKEHMHQRLLHMTSMVIGF